MSEKVRTLSLTSGNVLTATTSTPNSAGGGGGCSLIGAPTLISSTFGGNMQQASSLTPTPTATGAGGDVSPHAAIAGGSDVEASNVEVPAGAVIAQLNFHLLASSDGGGDVNSIMNSSQISATSNDSMQLSQSPAGMALGAASAGGGGGAIHTNGAFGKHQTGGADGSSKHLAAQSVAGKSCRFPKLEECAHFHYERVQLGPLSVRLVDDKSELLTSSIASQSIGGDIAASASSTAAGPSSFRSFSPSSCWFIIKVSPQRSEPFLVRRSFDNLELLDEMLHRCVYDRKISCLRQLNTLDFKSEEDVEYAVAKYLERFSRIASDSLTCGTILTWFQLDNKGRRLPLADGDTMRSINTPAVGAAYGVRRYQAQAPDEISIEVGDMISVIDMPSPAESIWWRGKKSHLQKSQYEVGFFPQSCVATIGDKVPRHFPLPAPLVGQLDVSPTKPVLRKHGKLIAFFRSFILSRPSRRRLKQSGIYRERVFSCDLSEHLLNSGQEIPMVLRCCAEFLEEHGIVDGIYRLSGITSNIQRLRRAFDEERIPDLGNPEMKQDIHAVSSLLKMYFRELPNPLCTYQLYDNFVEAIQARADDDDAQNERLRLMKETVLKLPPPHYRTLKYLSEHLHKLSQRSARTGMTDKNLAIVWAPNLLRSPALESGGVEALRGVGVQAVVTEYLIRNCHNIFDALEEASIRLSYIATAAAMPQLQLQQQQQQQQQPAPAMFGAANNLAEQRMDSLTDCESLLVEQREQDQSSLSFSVVERPKSLSTAGGPKLISLEEAQERHSRLDAYDIRQLATLPINMTTSGGGAGAGVGVGVLGAGGNAANIGSYIEVGGGPSSLPDKYHTVLAVPRSWQKRKTHSWKSLFTRNQARAANAGGGGAVSAHELKGSKIGSGSGGVGGAGGAAGSADEVGPGARPPPRQRNKDGGSGGAQVTFAEADGGGGCGGGKVGGKALLLKHDKTKSIELFETSRIGSIQCDGGIAGRPMEICVRSNSIDSLRTAAGHSRSVSHDSYFDMLQSPQRGSTLGNTCPSRELSELGLNFDREEPEMRIFSESESLVSSPRVGKENIPPSGAAGGGGGGGGGGGSGLIATSRRIMRARPEEFSSQTNSVNPSPKKQPRLNLLLSPSAAHNWTQAHATAADVTGATDSVCPGEHAQLAGVGDESCCKRYKLEDQLSDIQYIDCSTPEHTIAGGGVGGVAAHAQTLYTSVQVHAPPPPSSTLSQSSLYSASEESGCGKEAVALEAGVALPPVPLTRYSYPSVQLGAKRKEQEAATAASKERFSYPGSSGAATVVVNDYRRFGAAPPAQAQAATAKMHVEEAVADAAAARSSTNKRQTHSAGARTVSFGAAEPATHHHQLQLQLSKAELLRPKNRNSYCGGHGNDQQLSLLLLRSSSGDISKEAKGDQGIDSCSVEQRRSKLSVTPSTPEHSPRYSLLVGETTSSENSSALNTPQYDLDPLMVTSAMSCLSGVSAASSGQQQHPLLLGVDGGSSCYLGTSRESLGSNLTSHSPHPQHGHHLTHQQHQQPPHNSAAEKRDMQALKRELSLDLNPLSCSTKLSGAASSTVGGGGGSIKASSMLAAHAQQPSPNNSNFTDNTSQSVTPSEFGYQHLQRQSSAHSLIETAENSPAAYDEDDDDGDGDGDGEEDEEEHSHAKEAVGEAFTPLCGAKKQSRPLPQPLSPLKSTISITYNLRSPTRKEQASSRGSACRQRQAPPGETNNENVDVDDDEHSVYERVKLFRNSVTEVNQLLGCEEQQQHRLKEIDETCDIQMGASHDAQDKEAIEAAAEQRMYENVELRKPQSVYANLLGEDMRRGDGDGGPIEATEPVPPLTLELDSLDSLKTTLSSAGEEQKSLEQARKSPSNFSVKELATKFETSPVEQLVAFDFGVARSSLKKPTLAPAAAPTISQRHNQPEAQPQSSSSKPAKKLLSKSQQQQQQITRSLDENAFVREFGAKQQLQQLQQQQHELTAHSQQLLPASTGDVALSSLSNRRKSFDFTRPKTLNPPKRLPGMAISEEVCLKGGGGSALNQRAQHLRYASDADYNVAEAEEEELLLAAEAAATLKITPTTENRISLIQQNNVGVAHTVATVAVADLNNSNVSLNGASTTTAAAATSMKVLSGVKLDRERIDKIKEERRQQLTQKYRTESFKSRSKTELNSIGARDDVKFQAESLRVKSKSRGDMHALQKDIALGVGGAIYAAGSESTLCSAQPTIFATQRVRSISDEKNQNCDAAAGAKLTASATATTAASTITHHKKQPSSTSSSGNNTASDSSTASDDYPKRASTHGGGGGGSDFTTTRSAAQKFERKSLDLANGISGVGVAALGRRELSSTTAGNSVHLSAGNRSSLASSTREKISPQFSIRDVTAMFESRSQNQQ